MAIGKTAEVGAFEELLELLRFPSSNVRRLATSALGKLAVFEVGRARAIEALVPVMLRDPHAQTRQYAIRAIKAYGTEVARAAEAALHRCQRCRKVVSPDEYQASRCRWRSTRLSRHGMARSCSRRESGGSPSGWLAGSC